MKFSKNLQGKWSCSIKILANIISEIGIKVSKIKGFRPNQQTLISNLRYTEEGLAVKIITDQPLEDVSCVQAAVNLEDVYLYYFEKWTN